MHDLEPEWRRFDGWSALRQWLAFPSTQWTSSGPSRHERRGFLVEFDNGAVAFLRVGLDFRWTEDRMRAAARLVGELAGTGQPDLARLAMHFGDALDTSIDIATPALTSANLEHWQARRLAVHHVTSETLSSHPSVVQTVASEALQERVEYLVDRLQRQLAAGTEAFVSNLQQDAVRHAMSPKGLRVHAYNKLAGAFGTPNRNRIQFAEAFPIFMQGLLAENPPYDFPWRYFDAIDRGEPAVPMLASALGVRSSTIRFLVGKSPDEVGRHWVKAPGRLVALLEVLPPELRPADESTWTDFNEIVRSHWGGALPEVSALLLRAWFAERARRKKRTNASPTELKVDPAHVRDVGDLYASLKRCLRVRAELDLGLPEVQSGLRARVLVDSNLKCRSWSTLASLARLWRGCLFSCPPPQAPEFSYRALRGFASLLPRPWPINGVVLIPLNTEAALKEEARAMHHCVDTYVDECEMGESFIVSIRNATSGVRLSTAELSLTRDPTGPIRLLARQHSGLRNATPPPAAEEAIDALQRDARNPELQKHWARILRARISPRLAEAEDEARLERIAPEEAAFRATLKPHGTYDLLLQRLQRQSD